MIFGIPWKLLAWARDNRVLRLRYGRLEAEFAVPISDGQEEVFRQAQTKTGAYANVDARFEASLSGLPLEERAQKRREREKAEAEKVLFHSA